MAFVDVAPQLTDAGYGYTRAHLLAAFEYRSRRTIEGRL